MFRKPSLADIYVRELSTQLDNSLIPLFTPDTAVEIGTTGRFVDGRFVATGHLRTFLGDVPETVSGALSNWSFASENSVRLEPQVSVPGLPTGGPMVQGRLRFTGNRAVVAAFGNVSEVRTASDAAMDELLWPLYLDGRLDPDEVVVWYLRNAGSGAVLVNRKSGVDVEVLGDTGVLGAFSLQSLAAGVGFGAGSQASFQLAGEQLVPFVRVKGLTDELQPRIESVRRFEADPTASLEEFEGAPVPSLTSTRLLTGVDFDAPE